jgi:triosephosphate isomerase
MRKKIVAGNWKMNLNLLEAEELIAQIAEALEDLEKFNAEVVICPPTLYIEMATDISFDAPFKIGAQNVYPKDSGAYTGEISAAMLKDMNVTHCIVGHSERRKYFSEDHAFLAEKTDALLRNEIIPIFCCGELLPEREAGRHFDVVKKQLEESLFHLSEADFATVVIAYEPVWAIGTGVTASPEQAQEMHAYIRELVAARYGKAVSGETSILYGGSCNAKNAAELFRQPDVDGGLIGGASLKSDEFIQIILAA